jgi:hypothetical protein
VLERAIRTIADLAAIDPQRLQRIAGPATEPRALARGDDPRAVEVDREAVPWRENTPAEDVATTSGARGDHRARRGGRPPAPSRRHARARGGAQDEARGALAGQTGCSRAA